MSEHRPQSQDNNPSLDVQRPWLRVAPPLAKRLNRNVLTVAAIFFGLLVIVALVTMRPSKDEQIPPDLQDAHTAAAPPVNLLEEHTEPIVFDSITPYSDTPHTDDFLAPPNRPILSDDALSASDGWDITAPPFEGTPVLPRRSPREEAYLRAVRSAPVADITGEHGMAQSSLATPSETSLPSEASGLPDFTESNPQALAALERSMQTTPESSYAMNPPPQSTTSRQSPQQQFLHEATFTRSQRIESAIEPAAGPYVLQAGTVIPGMLITGISSDLPGGCVGQVSRDVYDSRSQRVLLIPKGAKLICRYNDEVGVGQDRVLVAWTRILYPDGRSIALPGLGITDEQGAAGVKDRVDNHYRKVFGNAILLSLIAAGTQLSQPQDANSPYGIPSTRQVAAGAIGQELSTVATEIIRRNMNIQPTISIRPGTPFNVFLNGDLVLDEPYTDQRSIASSRP